MDDITRLKNQLEKNRRLILKQDDAQANLFKLYLDVGHDPYIIEYLLEAYNNKDKPLPDRYNYRENYSKLTHDELVEIIFQDMIYNLFFELEIFRVKNFPRAESNFEAVLLHGINNLNHDEKQYFIADLLIEAEDRITELEHKKLNTYEVIKGENLPYDLEKKSIVSELSWINQEIKNIQAFLIKSQEIINSRVNPNVSSIQDKEQNNPHLHISWEQTILFFNLLKEHKIIADNKKKIGDAVSLLTGYNSDGIRQNLTKRNIESIENKKNSIELLEAIMPIVAYLEKIRYDEL